MAPSDAATPQPFAATVPLNTITATPATPSAAPTSGAARGRSATNTQASSIITIGDVAITVAARLVGNSWAVRNINTKNAPTLSVPSTSERHHHCPCGSRRHITSSSSPAGRARNTDAHSGWPAGRNWWVT